MSLPLDADVNAPLVSERLLGTSAVLAHHLGQTDTARMIADVMVAEVRLWNTDHDYEGYRIVLVVDPSLYPTYDNDVAKSNIASVMQQVLKGSGKDIDEVDARPSIPRLGPAWRSQIKATDGPKVSNQGWKQQLEPGHPVQDQLRFTNEWELRVCSDPVSDDLTPDLVVPDYDEEAMWEAWQAMAALTDHDAGHSP